MWGSMEREEVTIDGDRFFLRAVNIDDIEAMRRLDLLCFPPERAFTEGYFLLLFLYHYAFGWGLEDEQGELAAFILLTIREEEGNVATIDVHPGFRRRGIASRLLRMAEGALAEMGVRKCTLQVETGNESAIALYRKLGYRIVRLLPRYYQGEEDGYLMEKETEEQIGNEHSPGKT